MVRTDVLHPAQRLEVARGHTDVAEEDLLDGGSQIASGEGRSVPVRHLPASRMSTLDTGRCSSSEDRKLCMPGPPEDLYIFLAFFTSLLPNLSAEGC